MSESPLREEGVRQVRLWQRLDVRTTFAFGALAMALLGTMGVVSYRWARTTELHAMQSRLESLAVTLAAGVDAEEVRAMRGRGDESEATRARILERFASVAALEPDVYSIYVVERAEREGFVRFHADWVRTGDAARAGQLYDARPFPQMIRGLEHSTVEDELLTDAWGPSLSGYAPIRDRDGRPIAMLGVDVSGKRVETIEDRVLLGIGAAYGLALLGLAINGILLGRSVRRPIGQIIDASAAIVRGEPGARVRLQRNDELGLMAEHFDRMAAGLEERERLRGIFGRYVSEGVARRALSSADASRLGGEEREVTILFVSLHRFAGIVEILEPTELVHLLDRYLDAVTELADEHGGCVIEMLGAAVLIVFGAPEALDDHPTAAVRCGLAIKARVDELDAASREADRDGDDEAGEGSAIRVAADMPPLRARIGVHTGRVVAGNAGGRSRMKYAVIGDAVNVAARVEALNEKLGTRMLVSRDTHERLPDPLDAEPMGEHAVKGRAQPVVVFAY